MSTRPQDRSDPARGIGEGSVPGAGANGLALQPAPLVKAPAVQDSLEYWAFVETIGFTR